MLLIKLVSCVECQRFFYVVHITHSNPHTYSFPYVWVPIWEFGSTLLSFDMKWKWLIIFTPRSLYPQWKYFRHPLEKREVGAGTGLDAVEKIKSQAPTRNMVVQTAEQWLYWLSYLGSQLWKFQLVLRITLLQKQALSVEPVESSLLCQLFNKLNFKFSWMRILPFNKPPYCVPCIVHTTQLIQEALYKRRAMNRFLNAILKITNYLTANRRMSGPLLCAAPLYSPDDFNKLKASDP